MRAIYMPQFGTKFQPNLQIMAKLLPDVHRLIVTYFQPSPSSEPLYYDLVDVLKIEFKNKKELEIAGVFLWKFRETVPPGLGTEEQGYDDINPYGKGTCEAMMARIREAHDHMHVCDPSYAIEVNPPKRAVIDLVTKEVETTFVGDLDSDNFQSLMGFYDFEKTIRNAVLWCQKTIREALKKPLLKTEMYEVEKGMFGNRHVEYAWPKNAVKEMPMSELLKKSAFVGEGCPVLRSFLEVISEEIATLTNSMFADTIKKLMLSPEDSSDGGNKAFALQAMRDLQVEIESHGLFDRSKVIKAFSESKSGKRIFEWVWSGVLSSGIKLSIQDYLNIDAQKTAKDFDERMDLYRMMIEAAEERNLQPSDLIENLLRLKPQNGKSKDWPPLDGITVADLLEMKMTGGDIVIPLPGYGILIKDFLVMLATYAQLRNARIATMNHLSSLVEGEDKISTHFELHSKRILNRAMSAKGVPEIHNFLSEFLRPIRKKAVLEVISTETSSSGMIFQEVLGTPEEIKDQIVEEDWYQKTKIPAFKKKQGEFLYSLFKSRNYLESEGIKAYSIRATLHNKKNELVAQIGFVAYYDQNECGPMEFLCTMDEIPDYDGLEAAIAIKDRVDEEDNFLLADAVNRTIVMRYWEVAPRYRGRGLGKEILIETLKTGFKGFPKATLLALNVRPAQFCIHTYGGDLSSMPIEIRAAQASLKAYWEGLTVELEDLLPDSIFTYDSSHEIRSGSPHQRDLIFGKYLAMEDPEFLREMRDMV